MASRRVNIDSKLSAPSAKRQRADEDGSFIPATGTSTRDLDLQKAINALDTELIRRLLFTAAQSNPHIASLAQSHYAALLQKEQARVIDFDHYSKSVWKEINITHKRLGGSRQYDAAGGVIDYTCDCIRSIGRLAKRESSFGTKRSALETLRKIGKTIALSGMDVVGREVIKAFQYEDVLEKTMGRIVRRMAEEEKVMMRGVEDGGFMEKLGELVDLAKGHCIMGGLKDVMRLLDPEGDYGADVDALDCGSSDDVGDNDDVNSDGDEDDDE